MFKFRKSLFARLMLLSALLVLIAACGMGQDGDTGAGEPADSPGAAGSPADSSTASGEPVTLTWLIDESPTTRDMAQSLVDAYTAQHPNVTINIETRRAAPKVTTSSKRAWRQAKWPISSRTIPAHCFRP